MGSSGSGRISDYPGSSSQDQPGGGAGSNGGPPEDRCARAFSVRLEDVEQSDHYLARGSAPSVGTRLEVVQRKRLVAQAANGESVGNLPTSHNYLASCLSAGWKYVGAVQGVSNGPPVIFISADFAATSPP